MLREGGGLVDLVRADNPLLFAAPSSIDVPRQRRLGADQAHRRRRRGGNLDGQRSACRTAHPGVTVTRRRHDRPSRAGSRVHGDGDAARPRTATSPGSSSSHTEPTRAASRSGSRSTIPSARHRARDDRSPSPASTAATTVGGAESVSRYRYPTAGDVDLSGARGRLPRPRDEADRELRRRRPLGPRRSRTSSSPATRTTSSASAASRPT